VASPGPALARSFAVFGALAAVTLSVVVPDQRVLVGIGYLPIFVAGLPWDFPPISYSEAWPWPVQNQLLLMLGGALWAATALVAARHAAVPCSRWAWRSGGARCSRGGSRCCAAGGCHRRWRSSRRRFVAVAVTSAGLTVDRLLITERDTLPMEDIAAVVPMAPWPLWGIALAAATLAYHLRRRNGCPACHRGWGSARVLHDVHDHDRLIHSRRRSCTSCRTARRLWTTCP
jgi:hypothetical protein